jgi:protein involved in polysaccharide export with SLBB domain
MEKKMLFRLVCLVVSTCFVLSNAESDPLEILRKKANDNQDIKVNSLESDMKSFMGNKFLKSNTDESAITNKFTNQVSGFDEKLDESKYLIGTGDGLTVYLWGTLNSQINAVVNIEGELVLQGVGAINVKGKSLRECKEAVKKKIFEQYKSVDITIVLSKIRDFKVYVLGEVVEPGAYIVNGATRISDVLQLSKGVNDSALLRNIAITNSSNATVNSSGR